MCRWSGITRMDITIKIFHKNHCLQQVQEASFLLVKVIDHWFLVHQGGWFARSLYKDNYYFNTPQKLDTKLGNFTKLKKLKRVQRIFLQKSLPSTNCRYLLMDQWQKIPVIDVSDCKSYWDPITISTKA